MTSNGCGVCIVAFDQQQLLSTSIRHVSNELFDDLSSCISFSEQTNEEKAVVLITTTIDEHVLQKFELLASIEGILILSTIEKDIDILPSKVIGIYPTADSLLRSLSEFLDLIEIQLTVRSLLFHRQKNGDDNLGFYFHHLWKTYTKDPKPSSKKSLVDYSRRYLRHQTHINDFETSYKSTDVLSWFDRQRHPFPYHLLLANALRKHHQDILSHARFFLEDFNRQMKPAAAGQVYLGIKLPVNFIDELEQQTKTDIIAFQCFLPVTKSRATALIEATRPIRRQKMANVLFKIDLNNAPCVTQDETLIIDVATPFHVSCVTRSSGTGVGQQLLTIVKLVALDRPDREQLYEQFLQRQKKLGKTAEDLLQKLSSDISEEEMLADEHLARSEWSQAGAILARIPNPNIRVLNKYGCLLREHLGDLSGALKVHQQALNKATHRQKAETNMYLGLVYNKLNEHKQAFDTFSQALQYFENEKKQDLPLIARCLIGLGNAQWGMHKLDEALDYAERALAIREHQIKPTNDFDIAACLGNIGNILYDQGDLQRALSYATRAVDLLSTCGKDDSRFAAALNNLGAMHQANGNLAKAREYFQRALEALPDENHAHRKSTMMNIARLDEYENAKK